MPAIAGTAAEAAPTHTPSTSQISPTALSAPQPVDVWLCDCLPDGLRAELALDAPYQLAARADEADLRLLPAGLDDADDAVVLSGWVYLLAAPFPTVQDGVSLAQLKNLWRRRGLLPNFVSRLLVSQSTYDVFTRLWGEPHEKTVQVVDSADLLITAWESEKSWAIIPFEEIDPRWKVMRVEGLSPLDSGFEAAEYALTVRFGLFSGDEDGPAPAAEQAATLRLPETNFDSQKLASVIMTGTTALVRYTALRMEENGVRYPGRDIAAVLSDADLTHISNEVAFWGDCPPAQPVRLEARFCSDPAYIDLLEYIGADVIELTGNHILDWGAEPLLETLDLYRQHGLPYYGGGADIEEASRPLTLQAKGQSFTFIGCSPAGPDNVWAGEGKSGSNPCTDGWLESEIDKALQAGSIPLVTFQHLEVEDYTPHSSQRIDFLQAAGDGAQIVSGSQSHFAQTMTFVGQRFVHYGLGNLFFDQMYGQNPHEFADRHYFYDGRYISTELISMVLEDAAKPRLMNTAERVEFLQTIFEHSNWETAFTPETQ